MGLGGFSFKRLLGVSAAKAKVSRATGVPLSRSGRRQKFGPFGLWLLGGSRAKQSKTAVSDAPTSSLSDSLARVLIFVVVAVFALGYYAVNSETKPTNHPPTPSPPSSASPASAVAPVAATPPASPSVSAEEIDHARAELAIAQQALDAALIALDEQQPIAARAEQSRQAIEMLNLYAPLRETNEVAKEKVKEAEGILATIGRIEFEELLRVRARTDECVAAVREARAALQACTEKVEELQRQK